MHIVRNPRLTSDFDFLVGEWKVVHRRLREPLTGSDDWYETTGTAISRTYQNGSVSVDEMWFEQQEFAASSFRLFDPIAKTWTIYWVTSITGVLQAPVVGSWRDGRLVAEGPDLFRGEPIIARYGWRDITPEAATWEQHFSADDGATWEQNWVMSWTRVSAAG
jgi:hypothetical protein